MSLASRSFSRAHFQVFGLGLEAQVLALASKPTSPRKYPVLGSRTALFFNWLNRKNHTKGNISDSLPGRSFFSFISKIIQCDGQLSQVTLKAILNGIV